MFCRVIEKVASSGVMYHLVYWVNTAHSKCLNVLKVTRDSLFACCFSPFLSLCCKLLLTRISNLYTYTIHTLVHRPTCLSKYKYKIIKISKPAEQLKGNQLYITKANLLTFYWLKTYVCSEKSAPLLSYTAYSNVKFNDTALSKTSEKPAKHTEKDIWASASTNNITEL